jgi:hypothetical protein
MKNFSSFLDLVKSTFSILSVQSYPTNLSNKLSISMNLDTSFSQIDPYDNQDNNGSHGNKEQNYTSTILENYSKWINKFLSIWHIAEGEIIQEYWVDCLIAILRGNVTIELYIDNFFRGSSARSYIWG